jgi:hypothetical protein
VSGLRSEQREGGRSRGRGKAGRTGRQKGRAICDNELRWLIRLCYPCACTTRNSLVHTGILTAPPQLVRSVSDNKSAHFAADRDPAIDKGPLERREIHSSLAAPSARAHCHCCCRCPRRVAKKALHSHIHTASLSSAVGSFKSPTLDPVARWKRHRHWNALSPSLPERQLPPVEKQLSRVSLARTFYFTLTGALLLAATTERERERERRPNTRTSIPIIYLREETRILALPQLSLSTTPVAHIRYHRYLETSHER